MRAKPDRIRPAPILHVGRFARVRARKTMVVHHVDGHKGRRATVWWHMRHGWFKTEINEGFYR